MGDAIKDVPVGEVGAGPEAGEEPVEPIYRLALPVGPRDHAQGPAEAPVTLVEYGDYQCPYCLEAHRIIRRLQKRTPGRLRYVYRHLPLDTVHPNARLAAEAAEAAAAQGKFWEMHDLLFARTKLDEESLVKYAGEIGLDVPRFRRELQEHRYAGRVEEDYQSALESGVEGTPSFFIHDERYDGPWDIDSLLEQVEQPLAIRVQRLAHQFTRRAASSSIVLLLFTVLALLWANSSLGEVYSALWESEFTVTLGEWSLAGHLLHWVNDGLMVLFFFVVGLEIKREILVGELSEARQAALPIAAAIGGMVAPAAIYLAFNLGGPGERGWGVAMATDIAFTLGVLMLLGRRVPFSLKIFFTALAIVDDLGAILVIALFYSAGISWVSLAAAAVILVALVALNRARVYAPLPYMVLGVGLWLAFLFSGVHPTIAGVLLAMTIPSRGPGDIRPLLAQVVSLVDRMELPAEWQAHADSQRQAIANTLETVTDRLMSPAQRLQRTLGSWTAYLILPLFALTNAGVIVDMEAARKLLSPVALGIVLGLLVGKPLGITLFSWLAIRAGIADLPAGVGWRQFISASFLAGIGFTMSLFIGSAAFDDPDVLATAKLGILVASVAAAVLGGGLLVLTAKVPGDRRSNHSAYRSQAA